MGLGSGWIKKKSSGGGSAETSMQWGGEAQTRSGENAPSPGNSSTGLGSVVSASAENDFYGIWKPKNKWISCDRLSSYMIYIAGFLSTKKN